MTNGKYCVFFFLGLVMAAAQSHQESKSISTDPEGPRVLKNQVSWAEQPCSPTSTSSTFRSSWFERLRSVIQTEPGPKNSYQLPIPCFLKIIQVFVSVATAGLYSEGSKEVGYTSVTTLMFPYLVACNYLIMTPVILLSYVIGHKMPEILVRIFNMLAVVLFITAGAICMQGWHFHSVRYNARLHDPETEDNEDLGCTRRLTLDESYKCGIMLFLTGLCCFINTTLYVADITCSLYTTLGRV